MGKHSVNLVISKQAESPLALKLKIILPIAAVASLFIFVVSFLASLLYIKNNSETFASLGVQIDTLEKKISEKKNTEGIYTLTLLRLKTVDQLKSGSKNYAKLLSEILKFGHEGVMISQTSIDKKNAVTVSAVASSSATLDDFVVQLRKTEAAKLFSEIKSSGIVRDKKGAYLLTISLKPDTTLLQ